MAIGPSDPIHPVDTTRPVLSPPNPPPSSKTPDGLPKAAQIALALLAAGALVGALLTGGASAGAFLMGAGLLTFAAFNAKSFSAQNSLQNTSRIALTFWKAVSKNAQGAHKELILSSSTHPHFNSKKERNHLSLAQKPPTSTTSPNSKAASATPTPLLAPQKESATSTLSTKSSNESKDPNPTHKSHSSKLTTLSRPTLSQIPSHLKALQQSHTLKTAERPSSDTSLSHTRDASSLSKERISLAPQTPSFSMPQLHPHSMPRAHVETHQLQPFNGVNAVRNVEKASVDTPKNRTTDRIAPAIQIDAQDNGMTNWDQNTQTTTAIYGTLTIGIFGKEFQDPSTYELLIDILNELIMFAGYQLDIQLLDATSDYKSCDGCLILEGADKALSAICEESQLPYLKLSLANQEELYTQINEFLKSLI